MLLLLLHNELLLLLLLLKLLLPEPVNKLVRVCQELRNEIVLVVVLQVIDLLGGFVVRMGGVLNV